MLVTVNDLEKKRRHPFQTPLCQEFQQRTIRSGYKVLREDTF